MSIDLKKYQSPTAKKPKPGSSSFDLEGLLSREITLFSSQLSDAKKERFYSELQILLAAGIDIKSALDIIIEEQKKKTDQALFAAISEQVIAGSSLSEAIRSSEKFSNYEYYSLQIGEESGRLIDVLKELTSFYNNKIKQKRQFTSALSYPLLVMVTAFGAVFFMMNFIVPMFAGVFSRFGQDLPALTKTIIVLSDWTSQNYHFFLLFLAALGVFYFTQRSKNWFRKYASALLIRLPLIGKVVQKIYLAQLCQSLALLISAKVPLIRAIQLVQKMIAFYPIQSSLTATEANIMAGSNLFDSFSQFPFYPKRLLSLVKVGEETNKLDLIFQKLADQYTEEVEYQTSILGSLIEPALIIFLGLMVGVILVAMYLPLFQLGTGL